MQLLLMLGASALTIISLYFYERLEENNKKRKEVIKNEKN